MRVCVFVHEVKAEGVRSRAWFMCVLVHSEREDRSAQTRQVGQERNKHKQRLGPQQQQLRGPGHGPSRICRKAAAPNPETPDLPGGATRRSVSMTSAGTSLRERRTTPTRCHP